MKTELPVLQPRSCTRYGAFSMVKRSFQKTALPSLRPSESIQITKQKMITITKVLTQSLKLISAASEEARNGRRPYSGFGLRFIGLSDLICIDGADGIFRICSKEKKERERERKKPMSIHEGRQKQKMKKETWNQDRHDSHMLVTGPGQSVKP